MIVRQGLADAEDIRSEADRIVSGRAYRASEPNLLDRTAGRFFGWLGEQLGRLFDSQGGSETGNFLFGWAILAVAAAALVWLLYRYLPELRSLRRVTGGASDDSETVRHSVRVQTSRAEWLRRAEEAERQQEFAAATHARYKALIAGLVDGRELPSAPGHTAGEHLAAFADGGPRHDSLRQATDTFADVWFGGESAGPEVPARLHDLDRATLRSRSSDA